MPTIKDYLRVLANEHKDDFVPTCGLNICAMATDCANEIERLEQEISSLRLSIEQERKEMEKDINFVSRIQSPPCPLCLYNHRISNVCKTCHKGSEFQYRRWAHE